VLCHLGKYDSLEAAVEGVQQKIAIHERKADRLLEQAYLYLPEQWLDPDGPNYLTVGQARDRIAWLRRERPNRSYEVQEEWEIEEKGLELYLTCDDLLGEAIRDQKQLDKLLECQRKYFSNPPTS